MLATIAVVGLLIVAVLASAAAVHWAAVLPFLATCALLAVLLSFARS